MKFISKLVKENDFGNMNMNMGMSMQSFANMLNDEFSFRKYEGIDIDDSVSLSIQASAAHCCHPMKTLDDLSEYSTMEIAIFKNGDFASVEQVSDNQKLIEEFEEYDSGSVYSYVPVELIEELYQELISK